jgi:5-methylcytosine-specific restriction protein A
MCLQRGLTVPATVADHITPHRGDWNAFLLGPLQSLCKSCHNSTKRTVELRGYSPEIGPDGWPVDPNHPAWKGATRS